MNLFHPTMRPFAAALLLSAMCTAAMADR